MKRPLLWTVAVIVSISMMCATCKTTTPDQQAQIAGLTAQFNQAKADLQRAYEQAKAGTLTQADLMRIVQDTWTKEQSIQAQISKLSSEGVPWWQTLLQGLYPLLASAIVPRIPGLGVIQSAVAAVEKVRGPPLPDVNMGVLVQQQLAAAVTAAALQRPAGTSETKSGS